MLPTFSKTATPATPPTGSEVVAAASKALFGRPLVVNVWRAMLVESMIHLVLPTDWTWCATDYAGWDFQHVDGTRLEVKQSAARQSWKAGDGPARDPRFDIAQRMRAWDGATLITAAEPTRYAQIYVLAYHPVVDDTADHRDPRQWMFHVIATTCLPPTRSISLAAARQLAAAVGCAELSVMIEGVREGFGHV